MSKRRLALVALVLLLGLLGCTRRSQDEVGVVARVNNRPITLDMDARNQPVSTSNQLNHQSALPFCVSELGIQ